MEDYKEGHRKRIRRKYVENKDSLSNDYEVLELLLTYAIPRMDVKPVAKRLLSTFGGLDNVLNANIDTLKKVDGVGENTAVLISLVKEINIRAQVSKNNNIKTFISTDDIIFYFTNLLCMENNEVLALVSLDSSNRIINTHFISEGTANGAEINKRKIIEVVLADNAVSIVIAHNHPNNDPFPSAEDIDFTLKLRDLLKPIKVRLLDHIIVGEEDTISLRSIKQYNYFEYRL